MTLFILSYLSGALTLFAPCILPVVPFVFARVDQPFLRNGLPMLAGMAVTFAGVASLAAVGGAWAMQANEYGRIAALLVLAVLGITLLLPAVSARLLQPVAALGARLAETAQVRQRGASGSVLPSFALGVATGLLWAPCAGPVLGLVLTGAAIEGANVRTSLLLLAYAAGAATSLALALWAGGRFFAAMKKSLGVGEWVRKGLGVAVLAGVAAVALGLDTGWLAQGGSAGTASLEQRMLQRFQRPMAAAGSEANAGGMMTVQAPARPLLDLPVEGNMPSIDGAVQWLNSPPLTKEALRGKVVLIDFWTYSCINCKNALPHVREWARKYKDDGLVVIGVHSPEFAFEKNIDNVKRALGELDVAFPVAVDNNFTIWRAFSNQYWPAHYFIDAKGRIRFHHFGEGEYQKSEQVIRQLLDEARKEKT
ncbi:cytochrome c biogenesis protein DipZ [Variovorax sp. PAMC 28711]|uniref:cytochrome c biogenesis protein DipZ n=1 Tax=Variovorax sp. PAMC 28711 TaxID=1795631 RepID=UPI00078C946E|nr:cytochrome c biogenesis protein DipZ [Variovorax sp. PAMC 28711]AMM26447.1 cytochrome C biogenesis protein [Variovorax sp. PAMC 28711]